MNIEDLAFLRDEVSQIVGERPDRLDEVHDRIRAARRRRASVAVGGVAVVLGVIVLAVAIRVGTPSATVGPTDRRSSDFGGVQVLAPEPFLTNRQASAGSPGGPRGSLWMPRVRVYDVGPAPLNRCVRDPRTWGASTTRVATYTDPEPAAPRSFPNRRLNEYLLEYASGADAHQAFLEEFLRVRRCWGGELSPIEGPSAAVDPSITAHHRPFDEAFAGQRGDAAKPGHSVVRIARAGNVLVVVEDATEDDMSNDLLAVAVHQAMPSYR